MWFVATKMSKVTYSAVCNLIPHFALCLRSNKTRRQLNYDFL